MFAPTDPIPLALGALGAFLLGSIPFALMIGLARGTDIRTVGSKNPGATNLGRTFGFRWFALCFLLDAGKGLAPTLAFGLLTGLASSPAMEPTAAFAWLAVMVAPVLGHMFSPWIGFKGGKGVATGLGALLGVYPILTIPGVGAFVVFGATLGIWRFVGLSSVLAAGSLPIWVWYFAELLHRGAGPSSNQPSPTTWPFLVVAIALAVLVIFKHRGNLNRLAAGTEPKLGEKQTPPDERPKTP
jgi:glycerol-3-phosphate acyltransferase PlsY